MKVSVAIITKNEEANIRGCIASCSWADEIVIIDSHSTDATVEIASSLGARVLKKQFSDYSTQKQFAVDSCQNDWVLSLDADERIEKDLYLALSTIDPSRIELAYTLNRVNHFFGQKVNFSGWKNEQVVRLFNRNKSRFNNRIVHEKIIGYDRSIPLGIRILHYPYRNNSQIQEKIRNYAELGATEIMKKRKNP